jgi:uncharacterized membrane protein
MAFCGNCGASLTQATGFCGVCGKPVGTATQTVASQAPVPPASAPAAGWTSVTSQSAPSPSAASSAGWSPAPNQPQQSASWTPTPAAPAATSQPSSQGWSSPAVGAPAANWNSASSQPGAAAAPAMVATTGTGLTPNIAGALAYSLGIITGVLFLVLEPYRRDRFVRFHAMQSILYFVAAVAFNILWSIMVGILMSISGWIAFVSFPIRMLISLGLFGIWLFLMFQAYNQREFSLPILGAIAKKQAG